MVHIFQFADDLTLNHMSVEYPVALPVDFDPSPLGSNLNLNDYMTLAFQDKIHFCKKTTTDNCQAWNFRTGQWSVDNGRPNETVTLYGEGEINGKLWVSGGMASAMVKVTSLLDEHGNWTTGPDLPQENR